MLYDILSPLVFFASLGGILVIIGRVVMRLRREQFTSSINSVAAGDTNSVWQPTSREVSQLLRPAQKSVHAIRSRAALFQHMLKQSGATITGGWQRWRQRRAERGVVVAVADTPELAPAEETIGASAPEEVVAEQSTVVQPRRRRLAFWRRQTVEEVITQEVSTPVEQLSQSTTSVVEMKAKELLESEGAQSASAAAPAASTHATPVTVSSVTAAVKPTKRLARHLLRRAHATPPAHTGVLENAAGELTANHYQAAEDMLVPYIVKHPKDTMAYMLLGKAALGRESWEEAIEIFEQVIKWNRSQPGAFSGLGYAAYRAGHFTRALQALQRAQDADPTDPMVLEYLLNIAEKMDNPALQHSIREKIAELPTTTREKMSVS